MTPKEATHTPGPWTAETVHTEHGFTLQIQGDRQGASAVIVADMPLYWSELPQADHATWNRMAANARLIASAPALYAALREYVEDDYERGGTGSKATALNARLERARAALALADGGAK